MDFLVSVIVPVYNAEKFIEKAINSALMLKEVGEVIVVNDGSTDNSLAIINKIQKNDQRVKIYHHKQNKNKGRAASRNLGIIKSVYNYIAFLDADDYYLENRFVSEKVFFSENQDIDGIYSNIGAHFYRNSLIGERNQLEITGVSEEIPSDELFEMLLSCRKGYFSIDGLTVKKSIFDKTGLFLEQLVVAEDTELFFKMALLCNLKTGIVDKPVAMRGVHEENIFNQTAVYNIYRPLMYELLTAWMLKKKIHISKIDILLNRMWIFRYKQNFTLLNEIRYYFIFFFKNPSLIFTQLSIKYFPIVRLRQKLFPSIFHKVIIFFI